MLFQGFKGILLKGIKGPPPILEVPLFTHTLSRCVSFEGTTLLVGCLNQRQEEPTRFLGVSYLETTQLLPRRAICRPKRELRSGAPAECWGRWLAWEQLGSVDARVVLLCGFSR